MGLGRAQVRAQTGPVSTRKHFYRTEVYQFQDGHLVPLAYELVLLLRVRDVHELMLEVLIAVQCRVVRE